jgi:hypothetical protein
MNVEDPDVGSRYLPPYRALVAVDTEKYSRNRSSELPNLNMALREVVETSMGRSLLAAEWGRRSFDQSTGDGLVFGVETYSLPFLLHPWLDILHSVLEEADVRLRRRSRDLRMRLRVSIHVGPVPDVGEGTPDPVSATTNDVFRLLNASAAREALDRSDPDVTFLAAVVSQRVFEDVVAAGYCGLHPARFAPVVAEIPEKRFSQPAWLYLPRPSAGTAPIQLPEPTTSRPPESPPGGPASQALRAGQHSATVILGEVGQAITAQQFHGGIHQLVGSAPSRGRVQGWASSSDEQGEDIS